MKKKIILAVLFLLPVTIVLILLFTTHNYNPLPVIGQHKVASLVNYNSIESKDAIQFDGKITILGFLGSNVKDRKINILNLNQKIYKRFSGFKHFQLVMLVLPGQEEEIQTLKYEMSRFADELKAWNFVEVDEKELRRIFDELQSPLGLDGYNSSDYVYIIDKDRNIRGRLDDRSKVEIKENKEPYKLYGYDTIEISVLSGKMTDDIRILFEEYRGKSKKEQSQDRRKEDIKNDKE